MPQPEIGTPLNKPLATKIVPPQDGAPSSAPTVTFSGDSNERDSAQVLLDATEGKLRKIHRDGLLSGDAATYDQASGFVHQAQQAMMNKDYAAASGFAHKASMLADKLTTAGP